MAHANHGGGTDQAVDDGVGAFPTVLTAVIPPLP